MNSISLPVRYWTSAETPRPFRSLLPAHRAPDQQGVCPSGAPQGHVLPSAAACLSCSCLVSYEKDDSDLVGWGRLSLLNGLLWAHPAGPGTTLWPGQRGGSHDCLEAKSPQKTWLAQGQDTAICRVLGPPRLGTVAELSMVWSRRLGSCSAHARPCGGHLVHLQPSLQLKRTPEGSAV